MSLPSTYTNGDTGKFKLCNLCWEERFIADQMYSTHYGWQSNFYSCCVECEARSEYPAMIPTIGVYASAEARKRYQYNPSVHWSWL